MRVLARTAGGGRQEDVRTGRIHNYIDVMTPFPEWAK